MAKFRPIWSPQLANQKSISLMSNQIGILTRRAQVKVRCLDLFKQEYTKGGSITVPLASCLTGLDQPVLQIKTKIVSCHTADSKPAKQDVNGTVIRPPLVFPDLSHLTQPLRSVIASQPTMAIEMTKERGFSDNCCRDKSQGAV